MGECRAVEWLELVLFYATYVLYVLTRRGA
jgi:hypothetical protein